MIEQPLVSIIVPVHNTSQYLDQCIKSLCNQTLHDIEIICVNDASTDNSLDILKKYKDIDKRVEIIDLKENVMAGGARNRGIKQAKGLYLGFVDSDDFVSPFMYQYLVEGSNSLTCDIVTTHWYVNYGLRGETRANVSPPVSSDIQEVIGYMAKYGARLWTSIFKKDYFINNNFRFPEKIYYEDNALAGLFFKTKSIAVINNIKPLYYYRISNISSITKSELSDKKIFDRIESSVMMYDSLKHCGQYEKFKDEFDYKVYKIFFYNTIYMLLMKSKKYPNSFIKLVCQRYLECVGNFPSNNKYFKKKDMYLNMVGKYPMLGIPIFFIKRVFSIIKTIN